MSTIFRVNVPMRQQFFDFISAENAEQCRALIESLGLDAFIEILEDDSPQKMSEKP